MTQTPPNTARLVYAQWHDTLFPAYYADAQWLMYTPTGGTIPMPPPQAWVECPPAWAPARLAAAADHAAPAPMPDLLTQMTEMLQAQERRTATRIAMLEQRIGAPREGVRAYPVFQILHNYDLTVQDLKERITALEGAATTAQPDDEEPTVDGMRAAIERWWIATGPRRRLFGSDGWTLIDIPACFAACGPETGDAAIRAAYRALQKGGQR